MNEEQVFSKFRQIIKEELATAIKEHFTPVISTQEQEQKWISTKELCNELKVSKGTIYNWLGRPKEKQLVENNRQKIGNKVAYNITGIKDAIKKNPMLFGNGRDYEYRREAVLNDFQKANLRFEKIRSEIEFDMAVNEDDLEWYEAEKIRRNEYADARMKAMEGGGIPIV